jgi:hypothetical protein
MTNPPGSIVTLMDKAGLWDFWCSNIKETKTGRRVAGAKELEPPAA